MWRQAHESGTRPDDADAAAHFEPDPPRGAPPRRHRNRVAPGRGRHPSHDVSRSRTAQPQVRTGAGAARLGTQPGERIGTLAWNGYRHFEIYYGVSGSQRVCHTINPRLFPDQIAWIANDAADQVLCFDLTFLPLVEQIAPALKQVRQQVRQQVRHFVLMTDRAHMPAASTLPGLLCYEELIDAEDGDYRWPEFD
ncbi:MAG: AMP-binding protein, partial [Methyloversatilis sp.]|nr:AMP-binding protein [Methyloversatilis sp.]